MSEVDSMPEATPQPAGQSGRRRGRLIAIVAVFALAVAGVAYWAVTNGPTARVTAPQQSTVVEFKGSGNETTEAFEVREGWQIRWSNSRRFELAVTGDRNLGTVVKQRKAENGVTAPVGSGTFRLRIKANGPWTIRIVQVE